MTIKGTFQITDWAESVDKHITQETKLSTAKVKQTYTGDLVGVSEVTYQLYYDASGNVLFVGFETIELDSASVKDTLVLQHQGAFKEGIASSKFTVVACSNDSQWLGKTGTSQSQEGGKAVYSLNVL